jgi:hypothetical protein
MTSNRSGMAMANWSSLLENALNPVGATIFGAPDEDELVDRELLDRELLERDEDEVDDDDVELSVADAFFLLPSSFVAKNTMPAMMAMAATTMAMIGPVPMPDRAGAGTGPGVAPGAGVGAAVGTGAVGGVAPNGCVGDGCGGWAGACSGGYHLPSDACHQPGPCD